MLPWAQIALSALFRISLLVDLELRACSYRSHTGQPNRRSIRRGEERNQTENTSRYDFGGYERRDGRHWLAWLKPDDSLLSNVHGHSWILSVAIRNDVRYISGKEERGSPSVQHSRWDMEVFANFETVLAIAIYRHLFALFQHKNPHQIETDSTSDNQLLV